LYEAWVLFLTLAGFKLVQDPLWGFDTPFICYHRPISAYWKAITKAGLTIKEFEEPGIGIDHVPCVILFLLEK
jgi:hypothetical protein